jgi:hypothetical protein
MSQADNRRGAATWQAALARDVAGSWYWSTQTRPLAIMHQAMTEQLEDSRQRGRRRSRGGDMATNPTRQDATSKVVKRLAELGIVRGVLVQMAKNGQILEIRCEMPECYYHKGRRAFEKKGPSLTDWILTIDHNPVLKADEGARTAGNVRLAHRLCNRVSYSWRTRITPMLDQGMSLEQIAEELNRKNVQAPHGTNKWTAATVRKAFVS